MPRVLLLALVAILVLRWALRRLGWAPDRALIGGVAGSYALSAALILFGDPADLPGGGRVLAAAIWGAVHLLAFVVLYPFLGRARRA